MSSGAHTCDTSGAHIQEQIFYYLEPRDYSRMVLYIYLGNYKFEVYTVDAGTIPNPGNYLLTTDALMLFKVPKGFGATLEIRAEYEGRYFVNMQLHPYSGSCDDLERHSTDANRQLCELKRIFKETAPVDTNAAELGICVSTIAECPGKFSPCTWGQVVKKIGDKCQCAYPWKGDE